uniref:CBS domain-containing protein n=1 Tax=Amphimedon queenslandica TaxID=400682 RepID=A0A1X7T760_AMPQE
MTDGLFSEKTDTVTNTRRLFKPGLYLNIYELIDARKDEDITEESRVFFLDKSHRLQEAVVDSDVPSVNIRGTIDPAPIQVSDQTPMKTVVELFGKMGLRQAFVSRNGRLLGIVTKKDMLRHVSSMEKNPYSIQYH